MPSEVFKASLQSFVLPVFCLVKYSRQACSLLCCLCMPSEVFKAITILVKYSYYVSEVFCAACTMPSEVFKAITMQSFVLPCIA